MSLSRRSNTLVTYVEKMLAYLAKDEIKELKISSKEAYIRKVHTRFQDLKEKHPSIFNMVADLDDPSTFQMDRLKYMLRMKDQIDQGRITTEAASVQIGQEYFDEFVKPVVGGDSSTNNN